MSSLQQFLAITADSQSDHAWSEVGVEQAILQLDTFSSEDWQTLREIVPSLPDGQLQRIAYALSDAPQEAYPLLIQLIGLGHDDTALAACDVLRAQLEQQRSTIAVSPHIYNYVTTLSKAAREPWRTSCENLLRHLSPTTPG